MKALEPTSFCIRPAKSGEEAILFELILELAEYEGKDVAALPINIESLKTFGFGEKAYFHTEFGEIDEKVVAYALYYYGFSANQGYPILYLEDLYVKPEYRNLGIGTRFLKRLAQHALQRNCCRLEWHVFSWNREAINFYKKIGGILKEDLIQVRLEKERLPKITSF